MPFRIPAVRIFWDSLYRFGVDDGWAMASHVALSTLMATFPFLIFSTALASFVGGKEMLDAALPMVFEAWPKEIAGPISVEVRNVLAVQRGGLLTLSVLAAGFFASNGVEALRTSLNRAYGITELRSVFLLRLQSIAFVLVGALTLFIVGLLLIAIPVAVAAIASRFPDLARSVGDMSLWRQALAVLILVAGLTISHRWLPAERERMADIWPGIALTIAFWLAGSAAFVYYLGKFATYSATYAGLAGVVATIAFLYMVSAIFIYGGELNAAIMRQRRNGRALSPPPPPPQ
ncbi:MAG: YihY/virulence factor BrkB family protein [Phyllobacteriaceae bacterium]|nr:YihY/virulence factor BrkB family protein [Phyllobacteriaceae bacterium]